MTAKEDFKYITLFHEDLLDGIDMTIPLMTERNPVSINGAECGYPLYGRDIAWLMESAFAFEMIDIEHGYTTSTSSSIYTEFELSKSYSIEKFWRLNKYRINLLVNYFLLYIGKYSSGFIWRRNTWAFEFVTDYGTLSGLSTRFLLTSLPPSEDIGNESGRTYAIDDVFKDYIKSPTEEMESNKTRNEWTSEYYSSTFPVGKNYIESCISNLTSISNGLIVGFRLFQDSKFTSSSYNILQSCGDYFMPSVDNFYSYFATGNIGETTGCICKAICSAWDISVSKMNSAMTGKSYSRESDVSTITYHVGDLTNIRIYAVVYVDVLEVIRLKDTTENIHSLSFKKNVSVFVDANKYLSTDELGLRIININIPELMSGIYDEVCKVISFTPVSVSAAMVQSGDYGVTVDDTMSIKSAMVTGNMSSPFPPIDT